MGLDQYLYATPRGAGPDRYKDGDALEKALAEVPDDAPYEVRWQAYVIPDVIELGYWRKQNQIHRWFVENVQGGEDECNPFLCHPEVLADLMEKCKKVQENHDLAPELLPSQSGFFFGGTDYDEWYFTGIDETIEFLETALRDAQGMDVYYVSSW